MKKILWSFIIAAPLLYSCGGGESSKPVSDSTTVMQDNTTDKMADKKMADISNAMMNNKTVTDKDVIGFVQKVANVGMMEVELGNYASQHAKSQRVKDFGSMMVSDHTAAGNELKSVAMANNISWPSTMDAEHRHHVDMMETKMGAAFDKDYMNMMVNGHKETITAFEKAKSDLKEDAYKTFASKTLPVLQKHLDSAQAINKSM